MSENNWDPLFEDDYRSYRKRLTELRINPLSKRCTICHKYYIPESRFSRFCEICFEEQELARFDNEGIGYAL